MFSWVFWNVTPAALRQKKLFCKTETSFYIRKHWSYFLFFIHKRTFLTPQQTDTTPSESWGKELERALWKACPPALPFLKKKKNQCPVLFYLFIYFWLCWVFAAAHGLFFSCSEQRLLFGCSPRTSRCRGFSCCGAQALGAQASVFSAPGLRGCGVQA